MRISAAVVAIILAAGCGSTPLPIAPSPPAPTATSAAELEIASFDMKYLRFELGAYVYAPEITLREKSGKSFAALTLLNLRMPNGDFYGLGGPCPSSLQVAAGGTWKLTDLAFWCRDVDTNADISGLPVILTVYYADQHGVRGEVTSTATAGAVLAGLR